MKKTLQAFGIIACTGLYLVAAAEPVRQITWNDLMSVQSMVKDLYLVDGSAGIDIGYSMQANQIEPYK